MGISEELVAEIVRRILAVAAPARVILFGSAATGRMTRDSDLDLLIIERDPRDRRSRSVGVRQALRGLGFPIDVFVMSAERFEESKGVVGGLAFPAHKYGRVIYASA